jgi:A/G-specific adenine glycosylase
LTDTPLRLRVNDHIVDVAFVRRALITWGQTHFRNFPWRLTKDPYHILMAEIMLHRTQALQVVPVYEQFVSRYPDIQSLACASKVELHEVLYSLGLRWRIDLVYDLAVQLTSRFAGQVPREKEELLSLPGVSDYIASAVRCFVWNIPEPLIDTNTVRVVGRLFGLEIKDSSRRNRRFKELITALVDPHAPDVYNYALLDLADRVCMKKRPPACERCPVATRCAFAASAQTEKNSTAREEISWPNETTS